MYKASTETLSLSEAQETRARELLNKAIDGELDSPKDVVDTWEEPESSISANQRQEEYHLHREFVPPKKIGGSTYASDRLNVTRLAKVLEAMITGEYEVETYAPPLLQKRGEYFYVNGDGHHRSMAAKAIGLEELYAEYMVVPADLLEE